MNAGIDTDFLLRLSIVEHPGHKPAIAARDRHLNSGGHFALAPQVLAEFIHVVTDPRRFEKPLAMSDALANARAFWNAPDVIQTPPSILATNHFLTLMSKHNPGRKRILDTMLAATYLAAGVTHLFTGNAADYRIFPDLFLIEF